MMKCGYREDDCMCRLFAPHAGQHECDGDGDPHYFGDTRSSTDVFHPEHLIGKTVSYRMAYTIDRLANGGS